MDVAYNRDDRKPPCGRLAFSSSVRLQTFASSDGRRAVEFRNSRSSTIYSLHASDRGKTSFLFCRSKERIDKSVSRRGIAIEGILKDCNALIFLKRLAFKERGRSTRESGYHILLLNRFCPRVQLLLPLEREPMCKCVKLRPSCNGLTWRILQRLALV